MSRITHDELVRFASGMDGARLLTAGGRVSSTLNVRSGQLYFTPQSSGTTRRGRREQIKSVLARFEGDGSLSPGTTQSLHGMLPTFLA